MNNTLKVCFEVELSDNQIFEFLDSLIGESEPTDLSAEDVCIQFITIKENWDNIIDLTKCDGFDELKSKIKDYIYLKHNNPDLYQKVKDTYRKTQR